MLNYLQDMIRYDPLRKVKYSNIQRALHIRPTAATYGATLDSVGDIEEMKNSRVSQ